MGTRKDVALILCNEDVIELVSLLLYERRLKSTGVEPSQGQRTIEDTIGGSEATIVVLDLDPPYNRSVAMMLSLVDRFYDRSFVLTCADPVLALKSAPWLSAYPIFQKPYDPDVLIHTILYLFEESRRNFKMDVESIYGGRKSTGALIARR